MSINMAVKRLYIYRLGRTVDDVFATLDDKRKAEEILSYLNQQHPNIKFTIEHEVEDIPRHFSLPKSNKVPHNTIS